MAAVSFVILLQAFMAIDLIILFPTERAVYLRDQVRCCSPCAAGVRDFGSHLHPHHHHQASGLYHTSSFYLGRSLAETPFHLLFGCLVGIITYVMMGLQMEWDKFWIYVLVTVLVTQRGVSYETMHKADTIPKRAHTGHKLRCCPTAAGGHGVEGHGPG